MLLFMRGTDDGQLRVRLKEGSGIRLADVARAAPQGIAGKNYSLADGSLEQEGCSPTRPQARAATVFLRFRAGRHRQRGDEFRLADARLKWWWPVRKASDVRAHALKILEEMKKIPSLRDVQLYQLLDYPAVRVDIDREKAGLSGVAVKDITDALLVGTSSSRYVAKNYWRDPQMRRRLPGPGPGPQAANEPAASRLRPCRCRSQSRHQPDDP